MADYKKKRRSAFKSAPKVNKKRIKGNLPPENIDMTSAEEEYKPKKNMRVVKGKKLETKRKLRISALIAVLVAIVLTVCELVIPAGLAETLSNMISVIGSGSYPASLESTNTVNAVSKGSYYYVLTNNSIAAYSNAGKKIFSYSHGFENPVLKTSKTRALVFGQDSNQALIFTLQGLKSTVDTKQKIKNAAIGDDGTYALVTSADNYAAQISVYKKNNKLVYEWFSSKELVNNVAVAPSGKKIAVSTVRSTVGSYNSKLCILNFKSATAEYERVYEDTVIYNLDTSFTGGFSVLTTNEYNFIKWSNFNTNTYKNDYNTAMFRAGNNCMAVVYNRDSDKTDNRIAIFAKNGKLKKEIKFKGIITDLGVRDGHIYCISDTKAYILDQDGKIIRSGECGFGAVRICPIGQNAVAIITDNTIGKIKLEQE